MPGFNRVPAAAAGLALASGAALADWSMDYADVVHVQPLRRQVRIREPVREFWQETGYSVDRSGHVGALIGGVVGHSVAVERIRVRVDVAPVST